MRGGLTIPIQRIDVVGVRTATSLAALTREVMLRTQSEDSPRLAGESQQLRGRKRRSGRQHGVVEVVGEKRQAMLASERIDLARGPHAIVVLDRDPPLRAVRHAREKTVSGVERGLAVRCGPAHVHDDARFRSLSEQIEDSRVS